MDESELLPWESQVCQYPKVGEPGVSYFRGDLPAAGEGVYVDCLLYRNSKGHVVGILNHYPIATAWEAVNNVNIWVHPRRQRRGIGTILVTEAIRRWGTNLTSRGYTAGGQALGRKLGLDTERTAP